MGVGQVPLLGQGQQPQQPNPQQMQQAISQAAQGLSLQVYAIAAAVAIDEGRDDPRHLRTLAQRSMIAARCYFEGIGVIEQTPGMPEGQDQTQPG